MKADIKKAWIEALRSGEYKQGQGHLRNKQEEYCCLGVLCDLVEKEDWYLEGNHYRHGESLAFLPSRIQVDAGISFKDESTLINMNDIRIPFPNIATWIEENIPGDS